MEKAKGAQGAPTLPTQHRKPDQIPAEASSPCFHCRQYFWEAKQSMSLLLMFKTHGEKGNPKGNPDLLPVFMPFPSLRVKARAAGEAFGYRERSPNVTVLLITGNILLFFIRIFKG